MLVVGTHLFFLKQGMKMKIKDYFVLIGIEQDRPAREAVARTAPHVSGVAQEPQLSRPLNAGEVAALMPNLTSTSASWPRSIIANPPLEVQRREYIK